MTIQEYQKLASRTCAQLGGDLDRQHMILGVISEIGELADAYKKHMAYGKELDRVNVLEEVIDACWYVANWATFINKELTDPKEVSYIPTPDPEIADYIFYLSTTLDFTAPQYMLNQLYTFCLAEDISEEEFYQALENNINKLKVRYPDKFTQENALNRDLTKERTELEK